MWVQPARRGDEVLGVLLDEPWPGALSIASHGYVQCTVPGTGRSELLHRVLLGLRPGDGLIGDHRNRSPLDCTRANLRAVTPGESSSNVSARTSSGHRGVYRARSGRWIARGKRDGVVHHLGSFDTVEQAAEVAHAWRVANLPGYVPDAA